MDEAEIRLGIRPDPDMAEHDPEDASVREGAGSQHSTEPPAQAAALPPSPTDAPADIHTGSRTKCTFSWCDSLALADFLLSGTRIACSLCPCYVASHGASSRSGTETGFRTF